MSQDKPFSYRRPRLPHSGSAGRSGSGHAPFLAVGRGKPTACGRMCWPLVVTGLKHGYLQAEGFCQPCLTRRVKASGSLAHGGVPWRGPIRRTPPPLQDSSQATSAPGASVLWDFLDVWFSDQTLGTRPSLFQAFSVSVTKPRGAGWQGGAVC